MKVSELIDHLQKLPPDDEVLLDWHEEIRRIYQSRLFPQDTMAWILSDGEDD